MANDSNLYGITTIDGQEQRLDHNNLNKLGTNDHKIYLDKNSTIFNEYETDVYNNFMAIERSTGRNINVVAITEQDSSHIKLELYRLAIGNVDIIHKSSNGIKWINLAPSSKIVTINKSLQDLVSAVEVIYVDNNTIDHPNPEVEDVNSAINIALDRIETTNAGIGNKTYDDNEILTDGESITASLNKVASFISDEFYNEYVCEPCSQSIAKQNGVNVYTISQDSNADTPVDITDGMKIVNDIDYIVITDSNNNPVYKQGFLGKLLNQIVKVSSFNPTTREITLNYEPSSNFTVKYLYKYTKKDVPSGKKDIGLIPVQVINNEPANDSDEIAYDNTISGLTSDNVKGAIDELKVLAGNGGASNVTFEPSGTLSSANVQSAIEELDTEKEPANSNIQTHIGSTINPHSVTKTQVGLGNVTDNAQVKKITSSTDNAILRWDGTTGDTVQDSLATIDDNGSMNIPAGQSYKVNNVALVSNATHSGEVTGDTTLALDKTAISNKTEVTCATDDYVLVNDTSDSGNLKKVTVQSIVSLASGGATNLSYTPSTRLLESSTGTDVTLPLFTSTEAGLVPAGGAGSTAFLRQDGQWAVPNTGGDVSSSISSTTDNKVARFDSTTGKLIQDSLMTIDDSGSVNIPAGQAYKINNVEWRDVVETLTNKTINSPTITGTPTGITATHVGLGSVTNNAQVKKIASSTDNAIMRFDGTTGDLPQDSLVTISDTGTINIPTGQNYNINGVNLKDVSETLTNKTLTSPVLNGKVLVGGASDYGNRFQILGRISIQETTEVSPTAGVSLQLYQNAVSGYADIFSYDFTNSSPKPLIFQRLGGRVLFGGTTDNGTDIVQLSGSISSTMSNATKTKNLTLTNSNLNGEASIIFRQDVANDLAEISQVRNGYDGRLRLKTSDTSGVMNTCLEVRGDKSAVFYGNVYINSLNSTISGFTATPPKAIISSLGTASVMLNKTYSSIAHQAGMLCLGKSRGGAIGTETTTLAGDNLGYLAFEGVGSSNTPVVGVSIEGIQYGTATATQLPTYLSIKTSNGTSLSESMRIDSAGVKIASLAGTGNRMVVADSTGNLSPDGRDLTFGTTSLTPVNTGIGVNGGWGGKTIMAYVSIQWDATNATGSAIYMIRCGYNGDFFNATLISSDNYSTFQVVFTQVNGHLYVNLTNPAATRIRFITN